MYSAQLISRWERPTGHVHWRRTAQKQIHCTWRNTAQQQLLPSTSTTLYYLADGKAISETCLIGGVRTQQQQQLHSCRQTTTTIAFSYWRAQLISRWERPTGHVHWRRTAQKQIHCTWRNTAQQQLLPSTSTTLYYLADGKAISETCLIGGVRTQQQQQLHSCRQTTTTIAFSYWRAQLISRWERPTGHVHWRRTAQKQIHCTWRNTAQQQLLPSTSTTLYYLADGKAISETCLIGGVRTQQQQQLHSCRQTTTTIAFSYWRFFDSLYLSLLPTKSSATVSTSWTSQMLAKFDNHFDDYTQSLRLVEVRIPNYVVKGSSAQLECLYDLDGESLYSVKWYKDGNEFYRYVPRDMPPAQTFLLPGVAVELHNSSDAIVTLRNVNLQSAGRFRCEVSGEAPSFQTVTEHGDMVVVSLPDQGPPKITGGRPRYQIGDWVRINCTVGRSKPAVQLSWFVNGDPAEPRFLRKYDTIISGREGLETSVLGLQFRVEQHHFRNGDMKLKCVASLSTLYWRSNEESVEGDRPQKAPVLESRETVYASNSRADPVQASKTDSLQAAHAPNLMLLLLVAAVIVSGYLEQLHMWQRWLYTNFMKDKQLNGNNEFVKQKQQDENTQQQRQQQQQQDETTDRQLIRRQLERLIVVSIASEINDVENYGYQSVMPLIQLKQQQHHHHNPHHHHHHQQQQQQRHICLRRQHWHINENNESVERKCKQANELKFVNLCTDMLPALTAMTASSLARYATTFVTVADDDAFYCCNAVVNEENILTTMKITCAKRSIIKAKLPNQANSSQICAKYI
ncbi:uncharacterized protein [Eurosta solidaginis]|uniref:uncharacterized protein n=1 Tax=Eurosta solidaginis TaxID=178769 RepID=UPI003530F9A6